MRKFETDHQGSFIACGVGILYKYTQPTHTLEIFLRENRTYLFRVPLDTLPADEHPQDNITALLQNFDKALQINALMISSHKTNDITTTIGQDKLQAIIKSAFDIAFHAYDAQTGRWDRLNLSIQQEFKLRKFKLKRFICPSAGTAYIRCGLETPRHNELTVRAKTTAEVMRILSEKIIQDLIAVEFAYRTDSYAHQLVTLSSKMGILSRIIDANYAPADFVRKAQKPPQSLKA